MTVDKLRDLLREHPMLEGVRVEYIETPRELLLSAPIDNPDETVVTSEVLDIVKETLSYFCLGVESWYGTERGGRNYLVVKPSGEMDNRFLPAVEVFRDYVHEYAPGRDISSEGWLGKSDHYDFMVDGITEDEAQLLEQNLHKLREKLKLMELGLFGLISEPIGDETDWVFSVSVYK